MHYTYYIYLYTYVMGTFGFYKILVHSFTCLLENVYLCVSLERNCFSILCIINLRRPSQEVPKV